MDAEEAPAIAKRAPRGVEAVARSLDLLLVLAGAERSLGYLASRTGLTPSTAHRLLATLAAAGYVRHRSKGRYALGGRVLRLAPDRVVRDPLRRN